MTDISIRQMTPSDLVAVKYILNHYIENTYINFETAPYTDKYMQTWFAQFAPDSRHQAYIAEQGGELIGFTYSQKYRPKAAYITSVETTVYLTPAAAGKGIGKRLGLFLLAKLKSQDVNRAYAGVALPNPASIALHMSLDYSQVGQFSQVGRKFGKYHDMVLLEYRF